MKRVSRKTLIKFAAGFVAAFAVVWLSGVRLFAFSGDSMAPAVNAGDRFIGFVGVWGRRTYQRYAMVIFELPEHSTWAGRNVPWMKRLVGMPGEHVELRGTRLVIDGREVESPWLHWDEQHSGARKDYDVVLGSDEYFVLGDNLDHSLEDSRSFGPLKRSQLRGGVICVLGASRN